MLSIIIKEIKHNFRNRGATVLMIVFPLILMWMLSAVFSGQFGNNIDFDGATVIYSVKDDGNLHKAFKEFTKGLKDMNIEFEEIENENEAIKKIEDNLYTCYISLNENGKKIKIYKNDQINTNASFIEGMLSTFVQRYNLISEIVEVNPTAINKIMSKDIDKSEINYVKVVSIDEGRNPRSIDYFGITMLSLIIMYSMNTGLYSIKGEQIKRTGNRIATTPINKYKLFLGKVLGALVVTILQIAIVMLFSTKLLGVNWGNDMITILLIIITEIIMCISVGVGIGFLVKNEGVGDKIINTTIPFLVFLGGGYFPIEQFGSDLLIKIAKISPVRWVNVSLYNVIYLHDYKWVSGAILINLTITILFLILATFKFRRREEI